MATAKNIFISFNYDDGVQVELEHVLPESLGADLSGLVLLSALENALLSGSVQEDTATPSPVVPDNDATPTCDAWSDETTDSMETVGKQMVNDGEAILENVRLARARRARGRN